MLLVHLTCLSQCRHTSKLHVHLLFSLQNKVRFFFSTFKSISVELKKFEMNSDHSYVWSLTLSASCFHWRRHCTAMQPFLRGIFWKRKLHFMATFFIAYRSPVIRALCTSMACMMDWQIIWFLAASIDCFLSMAVSPPHLTTLFDPASEARKCSVVAQWPASTFLLSALWLRAPSYSAGEYHQTLFSPWQ